MKAWFDGARAGARIGALAAAVLVSGQTMAAQPALPGPDDTDPTRTGLMQGSPPPADKQVTFADWGQDPARMRWSLRHIRELAPTRAILRGPAAASVLEEALLDLDGLGFADEQGRPVTLAEWQRRTHTDAMIVLHRGRVVYERYHAGMTRDSQHLLYSATKSVTGLLAEMLIADGALDESAPVTRYVPELAGTAWGDATVRQTLDMVVGIQYREDYTDMTSEVVQYAYASRIAAPPPGYAGPNDLYGFLLTLRKQGEHDQGFRYQTVNSEVLGWVMRRATGKTFAQLLSERIWSRMGAEQEASIWLDRHGVELMGAGMSATLRDVARFGEVIRTGGDGLIPPKALDSIRRGGDREKFKASGMDFRAGYSYRSQWWITHNRDGAFEAAGARGQLIHINPAAEMVVVKLSAHPIPSNAAGHAITSNAFAALADRLRQR